MLRALNRSFQGMSVSQGTTTSMATRSVSVMPGEGVRLNNISDNPGAIKVAKRLGRGIGSGKGKTSGRGHKGRKARSGGKKGKQGFEGGQTPLYKILPKRGFTNIHKREFEKINLKKLQFYIDMGRIDASKKITMKDMLDCGLFKNIKHGVKLLGDGAEHLSQPINIEVSAASASAIEAVEEAGGIVVSKYHNALALRAHLKPHKFDVLPNEARPPPKLMDYYTNFEKRGYLSAEMQALMVKAEREAKKLVKETETSS